MSTIWRPNVRIPIPVTPPDVPRAVDAGDEGDDAAADDLVFLGSGNVNDATGVHEPKKVKTRGIDEIYEDTEAVPTWPNEMKKVRMKARMLRREVMCLAAPIIQLRDMKLI